jgi:hypothetical protein
LIDSYYSAFLALKIIAAMKIYLNTSLWDIAWLAAFLPHSPFLAVSNYYEK